MAHPTIETFAEGKDLEALFGYGTTVDDLHITSHSLDTCGCVRHFAWSDKSPAEDRREVPVATPVLCAAHEHMWTDMHAHHAHVVGENQHKNRAHALMMEHYPKRRRTPHLNEKGETVGWSPEKPIRFYYSTDRELHFDLDHLPEVERAPIQAAFDKHYKSRRTFVRK